MRRLVVFAVLALSTAVAVPATWAGSPHFVTLSVTRNGNLLVVSGKEAGLGNETQVHIVVTATAGCVNPGDKHPRAANKTSVSAQGDFPVQNGKAEFSLTLSATFSPDCTPPMTVEFSDVVVSDTGNGVSQRAPGTY